MFRQQYISLKFAICFVVNSPSQGYFYKINLNCIKQDDQYGVPFKLCNETVKRFIKNIDWLKVN